MERKHYFKIKGLGESLSWQRNGLGNPLKSWRLCQGSGKNFFKLRWLAVTHSWIWELLFNLFSVETGLQELIHMYDPTPSAPSPRRTFLPRSFLSRRSLTSLTLVVAITPSPNITVTPQVLYDLTGLTYTRRSR
jgi:hypothetical protein